ncbi:M20 metallopeptidase family protein [Gimesia aquarii]|nr:M20 family metallopeptidase [Gimesia aquarii]
MTQVSRGVTMTGLDSKLFEQIVSFRRAIHAEPELSWHEYKTSDRIAAFLDELEIPYKRGVAGTGIVAELPGEHDLPFVALRADMDALPIQEETGLPFASQVPGVMHACGHDGHTSMLLGAAALLVQEKHRPAPIRFLFQPAEETGKGAKSMIEAGVLENVALIFGGHLDRHFPAGTVAVTDGPVNASSDQFHIKIQGAGGHAARPHEAIDSVVVGSLLVMALQTIVSREVNPAHPSVVTVGHFKAGSASNVIASTAQLDGSIRAQEQSVREDLQRSIERIARSIGDLHNAKIEVTIDLGTPPLSNPPDIAELAREAVRESLGEATLRKLEIANMGGEDFAYYMEEVPGCYVRFGSVLAGKEGYPAHSSRFDFDEQALNVGATYFHAIALAGGRRLLEEGE